MGIVCVRLPASQGRDSGGPCNPTCPEQVLAPAEDVKGDELAVGLIEVRPKIVKLILHAERPKTAAKMSQDVFESRPASAWSRLHTPETSSFLWRRTWRSSPAKSTNTLSLGEADNFKTSAATLKKAGPGRSRHLIGRWPLGHHRGSIGFQVGV